MRTLMLASVLLLSVLAGPAAGEFTPADRQRLLAHLEMTDQWLASELAGLSPAQATFRMTPESWSILDVVEHLAVAEPQYWRQLRDSMKEPANTGAIEATDAGILWYGIDRTRRARTGEARVPQGRFKSLAEAHGAFHTLRREMVAYAKETADDLRSRKLLEGNMDVYQWFLMISAHSQRHILQIREIKAHAGFPK